MMKKGFIISVVLLVLSVNFVLAENFIEVDDDGYPIEVELKTMNKLEAFFHEMFVNFGVIRPNPVEPGNKVEAKFYVTVECPSGCVSEFFVYDWEHGHGEVRVGNSCYTTSLLSTTFYVKENVPEGTYPVKGWMEGQLNCRASSTDVVYLQVGSRSPGCREKCDSWGGCIRGIETRVCHHSDCSSHIETRKCRVTTTTTPTSTTTTLGNGGGGGETDWKRIGFVMAALGLLVIIIGVIQDGKK